MKRADSGFLDGHQTHRFSNSNLQEDIEVSDVNARMVGKVVDVKVKVGDPVSENDEG
jgi:biotin carboxyl carrier protein